jgi:hypothetical protein
MLASLLPEPVTVDEGVKDEDRDPPRRVWRVVPVEARASAPSWVVGALVHAALALWRFPDGGGFDRWAEALARGYGITDADELRDAVGRTRRRLERFQGSSLYAKMVDADRRLHEAPYCIADAEGHVETGAIDALYRCDGRWVLVEFKTDDLKSPADLEAALREKDYVDQVSRYLDAAERLLGERPRPVLCFLNYHNTVQLVEDRW